MAVPNPDYKPGPGIPGDDLTPEQALHFDRMADKLLKDEPPVTYTPPPVKGYRVLTQAEVDLMNLIKLHGEQLEETLKTVQGHLHYQRREAHRLNPVQAMDAEVERIDKAEPNRWTAIARTHFQQGLMALTRAVAQPSNF